MRNADAPFSSFNPVLRIPGENSHWQLSAQQPLPSGHKVHQGSANKMGSTTMRTHFTQYHAGAKEKPIWRLRWLAQGRRKNTGRTTVSLRRRSGTGTLLSGKTTMCAHVYNHSLGVFFFSIFRKRQPEFSPTSQCPSAHVQLWKIPHCSECVREAAWQRVVLPLAFSFSLVYHV